MELTSAKMRIKASGDKTISDTKLSVSGLSASCSRDELKHSNWKFEIYERGIVILLVPMISLHLTAYRLKGNSAKRTLSTV